MTDDAFDDLIKNGKIYYVLYLYDIDIRLYRNLELFDHYIAVYNNIIESLKTCKYITDGHHGFVVKQYVIRIARDFYKKSENKQKLIKVITDILSCNRLETNGLVPFEPTYGLHIKMPFDDIFLRGLQKSNLLVERICSVKVSDDKFIIFVSENNLYYLNTCGLLLKFLMLVSNDKFIVNFEQIHDSSFDAFVKKIAISLTENTFI